MFNFRINLMMMMKYGRI